MRRSRTSSADVVAKVRTATTRPRRSLRAEPAATARIEVTIALSPPAADLVSTLLFESGATAIAVTEGARPRLRTCLPDDPTLEATLGRVRSYLASLRSLGFDTGPAKVITRRFDDRAWATRWKDFFRPVRIGKRVVVKPSWDATPTKVGEIVIEMDPGMAFGTGQHPTTKMCLQLLEEAMEQLTVHSSRFTGRINRQSLTVNRRHTSVRRPPSAVNRRPAVLDLGTGSGLLAITAFRLGAAIVLALDTDAVACRIASENVRRNGGGGQIVVRHGSLTAAGRRAFDVVLANLTAEGLIDLARRLARAVRSRGRLIISGILRHQEQAVVAAFLRRGMVLERVRRSRGWVGLMFHLCAASAHGSD